jgi:hypothetical protein
MKKWLVRFATGAFVMTITLLAGCSLQVDPVETTAIKAPGTDLVINEVFTISPDKYYAFSWIEIYNPTQQNLKWVEQDTIFYDAGHNIIPDSLSGTAADSAIEFRQLVLQMLVKRSFFDQFNNDYIISVDTGIAYYSTGGAQDNIIFPGSFVIVVSNRDRFDARTKPGPFDPVILDFNNIVVIDSSVEGNFRFANWLLLDRGEIQLKRYISRISLSSGLITTDSTMCDIVRYGDYRPTPDSYPGNNPVGFVPENYSIARYSGYYRTGNTLDAFYLSPDPIPGWFNQRNKR